MAGARKPGPAGRISLNSVCSARTPGSLGRNDAADPNSYAVRGDTPRPTHTPTQAADLITKFSSIAPGPAFTKQVKEFLLGQALGPVLSLAKETGTFMYDVVSPDVTAKEKHDQAISFAEASAGLISKPLGDAIDILKLIAVPEIAESD